MLGFGSRVDYIGGHDVYKQLGPFKNIHDVMPQKWRPLKLSTFATMYVDSK